MVIFKLVLIPPADFCIFTYSNKDYLLNKYMSFKGRSVYLTYVLNNNT